MDADYRRKNMDLSVLNRGNLTLPIGKCKHYLFKVPDLSSFQRVTLEKLPKKQICGVYALVRDNHIVYIGLSSKLKERLKVHVRNFKINDFLIYRCRSREEARIFEAYLILKYKPVMNEEFVRFFQ